MSLYWASILVVFACLAVIAVVKDRDYPNLHPGAPLAVRRAAMLVALIAWVVAALSAKPPA